MSSTPNSNAITGDGRAAIERKIEINPVSLEGGDWEDVLELQKCIDWITLNGYKKVCLQFPDEYLSYSSKVLSKLEKSTGSKCYILADSTYGSCCIDEKTANHVPDGDSIIHFGQSCLTPCSQRFPVLYVFTKGLINLDKLEELVKGEMNFVIVFDVIYEHAAGLFFEKITQTRPSVKLSKLIIPGEAVQSEGFIKHGRQFPFKNEEEMQSHAVLYIGRRALPNLLLALPNTVFKVYDPMLIPTQESISTQTSTINKLIRKRNYYIEKIKDANSVGILVGTLVVQNYLEVIERLKTILRKVQKKFYVVSIGEINPYKLGNFMDIDCFIFVGCPEVVNYYISDDVKGQFFQPILTPYDVELAFCDDGSVPYSGQEYIIDWAFLIEKGPPNVKVLEDDVSLITGGLRTTTVQETSDQTSMNQVVNWLGLSVNEDSPSENRTQVHKGRSGIAGSYLEEPSVN